MARFNCGELIAKLAAKGVHVSARELTARNAAPDERHPDDVEIELKNHRVIHVGLIDTERRALGFRVVEPITWCVKHQDSGDDIEEPVEPAPEKRWRVGVDLEKRAKNEARRSKAKQ